MQTFQKYYKRHVLTKKDKICAEITKTDESECKHDSGIDDEPCVNVRPCKKLYCNDMFTTQESQRNKSKNSTVVCVNVSIYFYKFIFDRSTYQVINYDKFLLC